MAQPQQAGGANNNGLQAPAPAAVDPAPADADAPMGEAVQNAEDINDTIPPMPSPLTQYQGEFHAIHPSVPGSSLRCDFQDRPHLGASYNQDSGANMVLISGDHFVKVDSDSNNRQFEALGTFQGFLEETCGNHPVRCLTALEMCGQMWDRMVERGAYSAIVPLPQAVPANHTGRLPLPEFAHVRVNPEDNPPQTQVVCNLSSLCRDSISGMVNRGLPVPSVPVNPLGGSLAAHRQFESTRHTPRQVARPPRAPRPAGSTTPAQPARRVLSVQQAPGRRPRNRTTRAARQQALSQGFLSPTQASPSLPMQDLGNFGGSFGAPQQFQEQSLPAVSPPPGLSRYGPLQQNFAPAQDPTWAPQDSIRGANGVGLYAASGAVGPQWR